MSKIADILDQILSHNFHKVFAGTIGGNPTQKNSIHLPRILLS